MYVYFADGIINSSDVYAQLSSGTRDIFVTSFPSHIEDFRRPASRSRIEQKFISGCVSALCDVNPSLSNTYF